MMQCAFAHSSQIYTWRMYCTYLERFVCRRLPLGSKLCAVSLWSRFLVLLGGAWHITYCCRNRSFELRVLLHNQFALHLEGKERGRSHSRSIEGKASRSSKRNATSYTAQSNVLVMFNAVEQASIPLVSFCGSPAVAHGTIQSERHCGVRCRCEAEW